MRTLTDCLNDLEDITKLEPNWNGYGAEPIPIDIIDSARKIIKLMPIGRKYPDRCLPTAKQTIHFEWEYRSNDKDNLCISNQNIYFEVEIYKDKYTLLLVQGENYSDAINLTLPI